MSNHAQDGQTRGPFIILAAAVAALAAFSVYDHAVMRRNFRDTFSLLLKVSSPAGGAAKGAAEKPAVEVDTAGLPAIGREGAPLELVLVSDFECPFCDAVGSKAIAALRRSYVDKGLLRIYYVSAPLESHKKGQEAARAAWAAQLQGKFWPMYDELFSGEALGPELYASAAKKLGLDAARFDKDMKSASTRDEMKRQAALGASLNLPGVPALIFDGEILVGEDAWAGLDGLLAAALSARSSRASPEVFRLTARAPGAVVVDVRTAAEFAGGSIAGAVNVDVNSPGFIEAMAKAAPKGATVLLYCKSGKRSATAWHLLRAAGYVDLVNLEGGIEAWNAMASR